MAHEGPSVEAANTRRTAIRSISGSRPPVERVAVRHADPTSSFAKSLAGTQPVWEHCRSIQLLAFAAGDHIGPPMTLWRAAQESVMSFPRMTASALAAGN